jgi:nucleoside-diphosphate-sugar epimerase/predicted dehydrogenase
MHFDASVLSLNHGLPVLCEKPLALSSNDCQALGALSETLKIPIFAGMVRRFMPSLSALRKIIESNILGEVEKIVLEFGGPASDWPWDSDTVLRKDQLGCLVNMGIHFLDYLEFLFGKLRPVTYKDDFCGGIEVNCDLELLTANGLPVDVRISWTHLLSNTLKLQGSRFTAIMNLNDFSKCQVFSKTGKLQGDFKIEQPFESGNWQPTFESCFVEQIWRFARAVRTKVVDPILVTPNDLVSSHTIIEWAYSHHRSDFQMPLRMVNDPRPRLGKSVVAVTGGTGFVGSHLIERLTFLGMESIKVLVRSFRTGAQISRFPISMVKVDLLDLDSCRAALKGAKHVFHLAYGNSGKDSARVTIEGTRNILNAALAERVESVVAFSTCTVWEGWGENVINENTPVKPALGEYGASKAIMQKQCLEFASKHPSMRVSVIAPGAVYGPRGDLFCSVPMNSARNGKFVWFDDGSGNCNYVYVSNLVDAAILAAVNPEASAECFIVVDGYTSWKDFYCRMFSRFSQTFPSYKKDELEKIAIKKGKKVPIAGVFKEILNSPEVMSALSNNPFAGSLKNLSVRLFPEWHKKIQNLKKGKEMILKNADGNKDLDIWLIDFFGPGGAKYSSQKIRQKLGWAPIVSLDEGIGRCQDWYFSIHSEI